jgi:hypothetical protein
MNTTKAFRAIRDKLKGTERMGAWVRTAKCCGVRELYNLPKTKEGIAATMHGVLEEGWTCLVYFGQEEGHRVELETLKEFGFASMGLFKSGQTELVLEGVYFTRQGGTN